MPASASCMQIKLDAVRLVLCLATTAVQAACTEPLAFELPRAASLVLIERPDTMIVGENAQFNVVVRDSVGREIVGVRPAVQSSNPSIVRISSIDSGLGGVRLDAVGFGTVEISTSIPEGRGLRDTVRVDTVVVMARWLAIAPSLTHTCGIVSTAAVACWGSNTQGQLGFGGPPDPAVQPTWITSNKSFRSVSAGDRHSCAVTSDETRTLYCWGENAFGQVSGTPNTWLLPTTATSLVRVRVAAPGWRSTCVLDEPGYLFCWGFDMGIDLWGGVSAGNPCVLDASSGRCAFQPTVVRTDVVFRQLGLAGVHACALEMNGRVECWGANWYQQLGDSISSSGSTGTVKSLRFQDLAVGSSFTCAIDNAGQAYCWGLNPYNQLGMKTGNPGQGSCNSTPCSGSPIRVSGGRVFASIFAGGLHACGLAADGIAGCWGSNNQGQLGGPITLNDCIGGRCTSLPVTPSGNLRFTTLGAGFEHTCGITTRGAAYCWGWNVAGQLGDGTRIDRFSPARVLNPQAAPSNISSSRAIMRDQLMPVF